MRRQAFAIASYRTQLGAARYRDELAKAYPYPHPFTFHVRQHPYNFAYGVAVYHYGQFFAWAGKRPKGGPRPILPVDSDGQVH